MKVFVGILVALFVLMVAFFAFAIMLPVEEDPTPETARPMEVGEGADVAEPLSDTQLAPEKQLELWDAEHTVFEIEWRLGNAFVLALRANDGEKLAGFFRPDFIADAAEPAAWTDRSLGGVRESSRTFALQQETPGSAAAVVETLLEQFESLKTVEVARFRVLDIDALGESKWRCRVSISAFGKKEEQQPYGVVSEHIVEFSIEDESQLATGPSIYQWSAEKETRYVADQPMMEEIHGISDLVSLRPLDNWVRKVRKTMIPKFGEGLPQHQFQMAVADFDNDGDPDVSIVTFGAGRIILRNDEGKFVYVTRSLNIPEQGSTRTSESGTTWFDFDNDGDVDLVSGGGLYRNDLDAGFVDVTAESNVSFSSGCCGILVCDYDCDGRLDLYSVNQREGLTEEVRSWISDKAVGAPNQLWRNLGDGRFEDVTATALAGGGERQSTGAVWLFANEDHYPDLLVANRLNRTVLLINKGDGTFEDASESLGATRTTGFSGGVTTGDIDNDGRPEVYMSALYSRAGNRILANLPAADYADKIFPAMQDLCSGSRLLGWKEQGGGLEDFVSPQRIGQVGWAWGATMFDINSDGWLDVYATSGLRSTHPMKSDAETCMWRRIAAEPEDRVRQLPKIGPVDDEAGEIWAISSEVSSAQKTNLASFQQNRLFLNQSGTDFLDASFVSSVNLESDSRSVVPGDINGDGAVDLMVGSVGGGSLRAFLNRMPQGGRVKVQLVGETSNKSGIGSRIVATVGDRKIVRDMFPATGFMSSGPAEVWLGVGDAQKIDKLSVRWPTGETQVFENVQTNQAIKIREGDAEVNQVRTFQ